MDPKNFVKLIKECSFIHPAHTMDFFELTQGLFLEVTNNNVNVTYHSEFPHLAIFKYTQNCIINKHWNKFSLMARGLILDLKNKKVVSSPFIKFFNYNEIIEAKLFLHDEFTVLEKIDGSLGVTFFYEDKWRVATCGSFTSEQAEWGEMWINTHIDTDTIDKSNTYLFEIIYKANKIVVDYNFEGLVLLSIFDKYGLEYKYEQVKLEASYMNVSCARQYNFKNMNSILKKAKILDKDSEGYVVRFKSGVRLKIKGDEYVRIHRLISKVTPLALWESILNGDDLEEVKKELPEEMENDFNNIIEIINNKLKLFIKEVEFFYNKTKSMTDKELGIYLQSNPDDFKDRKFKESLIYIYPMRQNKFYNNLEDFGSVNRRKIFKTFRPKSNILEGYTPSSIVNRFSNLNN